MPIGFYFLCFCFCLVLCGWFGKIAYDQYIADRRREDEERRRAEIEQDRILRWDECQKSAEGLWI